MITSDLKKKVKQKTIFKSLKFIAYKFCININFLFLRVIAELLKV